MILLVDNYDSFTYNLVQYIGTINDDIKVVRNDELTVDEIRELAPSHIILSPGPGYPKDAGVCEDVVRELGASIPIMGVCLGHQAICEAFGGLICHAKKLMHGKQSDVTVDTNKVIFKDVPSHIKVARYHSLIADREKLPEELIVIASDDENKEVMAVKHREFDIYGLQFHPESILTPDGMKIIRAFLEL